jgi:hypothetical protein
VVDVWSLSDGEDLRDEGIRKASEAKARADSFEAACKISVALGRVFGIVDADDVRKAMEDRGMDPTPLGNASGGIFKGSDWEPAGYRNSERAGSHARTIHVWRYVGHGAPRE